MTTPAAALPSEAAHDRDAAGRFASRDTLEDSRRSSG